VRKKDRQTAVVTGASSGIGKAIAFSLKKAGYDVIGTSRNSEKISNKIDGIRYEQLDCGIESSVDAFIKRIGETDILVNNAGRSQIGAAEDVPMKKVRDLFEVNFFGLVRLTQGFLPGMRRKGGGQIINISSMSGVVGVSFTPYYCATKFAVEGFSESLRKEVYPFGINVTLIEPGYIGTGLKQEPHIDEKSPYYRYLINFKTVRDGKIDSGPDAFVVARKVMSIINKKNPRARYAVGGDAPLTAFLLRLLPNRLIEKAQRRKFKIHRVK